MTPDTEAARPAAPPRKKPLAALIIGTGFGVGYLKPGPGTFGSLVGVILSIFFTWWISARHILSFHGATDGPTSFWRSAWGIGYTGYILIFVVAAVGVYSSTQMARWVNSKDPQFVVIDEVSGQLITYHIFLDLTLNWKAWLLGFLLFRLFDIWKPFPIRRLEKLPGGWGIMADDWLAGIYAAILLRLALHFNLL
jgi:phosphatidylglycerophosphatase A